MADLSSDALIFDPGPCRASKKREWIRAGFAKWSREATSLVNRK